MAQVKTSLYFCSAFCRCHSAIDTEQFASKKSAIFLILPEEDTTKNFMAGLMIQNLSRELFALANENGGNLKKRGVVLQ